MHALQDRPIKDYINLTMFYKHTLQADDESKKVNSVSAKYILV